MSPPRLVHKLAQLLLHLLLLISTTRPSTEIVPALALIPSLSVPTPTPPHSELLVTPGLFTLPLVPLMCPPPSDPEHTFQPSKPLLKPRSLPSRKNHGPSLPPQLSPNGMPLQPIRHSPGELRRLATKPSGHQQLPAEVSEVSGESTPTLGPSVLTRELTDISTGSQTPLLTRPRTSLLRIRTSLTLL
jgi:hypothetical protein